ncbi:MAG: YvcK family protein [Chlamydiae bacterium]|nr:YvcK family protein [Chlamydiota bacterium]
MKRITTLGGGTGNYVVLRGLKEYPVDLTAIVTMSDDGGSTGILRDELGVLPAGDVRQCIVALSESSELMRNLMNYRFDESFLSGHTFGNIFLSALEKVTGSFETAIEEVSRVLNIKGKVVPVTTQHVRLKMILNNRKILESEKEIYLNDEIDQGYSGFFLDPYPKANPEAVKRIQEADAVIIGPGGLYTSVISNLLVDGVVETLKNSRAIKIFVVNLMNKKGQTTGFKVSDYVRQVELYLGEGVIDYIVVNSQTPPKELIDRYAEEGDLVECDLFDGRVIQTPLLGPIDKANKRDLLKRNLIRHDSDRLARILIHIIEEAKKNASFVRS